MNKWLAIFWILGFSLGIVIGINLVYVNPKPEKTIKQNYDLMCVDRNLNEKNN